MSLTYASDRAVFFDPQRIKPKLCLKCATPTERVSPRTITARAASGFGRMSLITVRGALTLCKACDDRWTRSAAIGLVVVFSPLWICPVMVWLTVENHYLPFQALMFAWLASIPAAIGAWLWARTKLIQVHSIDEDGTIGLANVHPDVRDRIVELGEADYRLPG